MWFHNRHMLIGIVALWEILVNIIVNEFCKYGGTKMYLDREMYTYQDMECFGKMVSQWFRKK